MGTREFLLLEGVEIFLYYLGTLEIITKQQRNIPMEYYCGTMGIITRRFIIFLYYHRSLVILPTKV
jgi:hypothetical protein